MIHLSGRLLCADLQEATIVKTYLPDHIRLSRAEPGCLSFEVTQTEDPLIWSVEENFVDQAAFDAHQARTKASPWFDATQHIRRQYALGES